MDTQYEQVGKNEAKLTFDFTEEEFKDAVNVSFNKNRSRFQVPGFRKGKVPLGMVLRFYGEAVLYDDAIDYLVANAYSEAIETHDLKPVAQPELSVEEIGLDKGLKMTLTVDTRPEPELGEYKGVEAVKPEIRVSDDEVEAELKREQASNARLVPVTDRAAETGDTVSIDFEGFMNDEPFSGGKGEDYDLELGSGSFIPGFEEQITGHEAGDTFDVTVTFPDDYGAEDLAGQEAVFKVRLNNIKVKELPELDDEFAKDISEFDTLDEYKDSVRERLTERQTEMVNRTFEENVLKAVVANADIEIPESMIHQQMHQLYAQQDRQMQMQGFGLADYLQILGQTEEQYLETLHEPAEQQIATALVLEAVGEAEGIELSDDEKAEEIKRLAGQTGLTEDQVKQQIAGQEDRVLRNALDHKIIHFLTDAAVAVAPPEEPEEPEPSEEADAPDDGTPDDETSDTADASGPKDETPDEDEA